jgi:hypothetical protein
MILSSTVVVSATDDVGFEAVQKDSSHYLTSEVDVKNGDICLRFSSHLALYDFAKSLPQEAVFGQSGQQEFLPLIPDGNALVSDGVRMTEGSSKFSSSIRTNNYSKADSGRWQKV